jgi:diguanylate cyclase (GGDEF)-like protein
MPEQTDHESMMPAGQQLADVLSEFARTMLTDFPIQTILDHLVERIVDILPISSAGVTLISPGTEPQYIAATNVDALRYEQLQTELGEGPCLLAYETGAAVTVPDLNSEERFPIFGPRARRAGLAAVFTFPLRYGDHRLGALDLYRQLPGPLSPRALTAAQTLADVVTAYLLNARARKDLQDSSDRSRQAAIHDSLTGLPNRVLMFERMEDAFARSRRSGKSTVAIFVDLDRFKSINDTYGHRVGDELLVAVARRVTGLIGPGNTLARPSGDEFVAICEDLDSPDQATEIGTRLAAGLAPPFLLSEVEITITASIGIAYADHSEYADFSPKQLIHEADMAMYRAKREGRHRRIFQTAISP